MRSVVSQDTNRFSLADNASFVLTTGMLRSRMRSYEGGTLRGAAMSAIIVDNTHVQFLVRPDGGAAELQYVESSLTVKRFAIGGGWDGANFLTSYPNPSDDVSGQIMNLKGNMVVDVTDDAIYNVELEITNRSGSALAFNCLVTVYAELLPVEVAQVKTPTGGW